MQICGNKAPSTFCSPTDLTTLQWAQSHAQLLIVTVVAHGKELKIRYHTSRVRDFSLCYLCQLVVLYLFLPPLPPPIRKAELVFALLTQD